MPRITLILVNGNINRIRAMVSGFHFEQIFGFEIKFIWSNEAICIDDSSDLFSDNFLTKYFINEDSLDNLFNFQKIASGIHILDEKILVIKGGKKGEQYYLNQFPYKNSALTDFDEIFIVSGGIFYPVIDKSQMNFDSRVLSIRSHLYKKIDFHPNILQKVSRTHSNFSNNFIGLHLRYKDLIANAPFDYTITKNILSLQKVSSINSIYISGDSIKKIKKFIKKFNNLGFRVISNSNSEIKRGKQGANKNAIIDWLLLSRSNYLVHFDSSFGTEAGVYNPNINQIILTSSKFFKIIKLPIQIIYIALRKCKIIFIKCVNFIL